MATTRRLSTASRKKSSRTPSRSARGTRPARRTAKSVGKGKTAKRGNTRPSRKSASRKASTRRSRPAQREQLEFIELPASGSSGSSWEPDSYTPKAELAPVKEERKESKGFFGSLFGGR
ncbi:MAG: hypothetical protein QOG31_1447 [Thermoplasmata archaeon]|jgi:uncharacterized membrane protein|nr:hypothetical protein [Thermoplasmata archaeon]